MKETTHQNQMKKGDTSQGKRNCLPQVPKSRKHTYHIDVGANSALEVYARILRTHKARIHTDRFR